MKHQHEQVAEPVVIEEAAGNADRVVCTLCGGPALLCGGTLRCTGGPGSARELRWLVAIRAVYAGLVLTRTIAALWGGALLRFARQLAGGALASGSPPPSIAHLAAEHADPGCGGEGAVEAGLALAYLEHGDLERLSWLSRLLREGQALWLADLAILAPRAALTTPLEPERFALLAVLCDDCACGAPLPLDQLYESVGTYDAAIRCPRCGALPDHPLPGVALGELHPVGRCVACARASSRSCIAHDGHELDAEGLCVEGRATFDRALLEVAQIGRATTPFERDLVEALLRARRWALDSRLDEAAIARSIVTSPELMPFFAALAATNPEVGRDLAQIAGAPLDPAAADPSVQAAMTAGGGLAGIIANGKAAIEGLRDSLFGKPRVLAPSPPRRKRLRRKGSER